MSSPGWYPQPDGTERYFDGNEWTESSRAPQPPAATARLMPPAKKSGMVMWIIIGVIAVVVICCCGVFAVGQGSDDTDSSAPESTSSSQAEPSSETSSAAVAEAEEPSAKPAEKKKASKSPSSTKAPAPARVGADVKITAGELIKEFEGNELAADQKYKGKTVEVSGVVEKIDTELFNEDKYLLNITDGGDFEFLTVTCHDMDNDVLAKLAVGSAIKVIGDFDDGGDLGVDLKNCKVV